jgi:integrase/recombinase XerD
MRVGEVLKLTPNDIHEKKLTLRAPKSGTEREYVFIPQKVADRHANLSTTQRYLGKVIDLEAMRWIDYLYS